MRRDWKMAILTLLIAAITGAAAAEVRCPAPSGGGFIADAAKPRILWIEAGSDRSSVWLEHTLLGGAPLTGGLAVDGAFLYVLIPPDGRLLRIRILIDGRPGAIGIVALPRPLIRPTGLRRIGPRRLLVVEADDGTGGERATIIDMTKGIRLEGAD